MQRLSTDEIQRQVDATRTRPNWTLPASWWDEEAAVNMAAWAKRFAPEQQQR